LIKRIAYTIGEPAGIGPDLAIIHAQKRPHKNLSPHQFVVVADPDILQKRSQQLDLEIKLIEVNLEDEPIPFNPKELGIIPIKQHTPTVTGVLNSDNAQYVLHTLDHAIEGCLKKHYHGMVTGPVQKSVINDAGIPFSGHTEYLANKTHTQQVVMMLATEGLRVALATTHIPVADIAAAIKQDSLSQTIRIIHADLKNKFGLTDPRILVCGLNPHAGEGGHLGMEEIEVITPTLNTLKQEGIHCQGPLPADTLFTPKYLDNADIALAMYHDQGLPVLKYKGFGAAANITLGLPIIRTSVDHGTALDLAGTGNIDLGSLLTALDYALTMNSDNHTL